MKFLSLLFALVLLAAMVLARPGEIIDFDQDDHFEHEQDGIAGQAVRGEYSWVAADGTEYETKYVADHLGYRLVD
ncbi:hypothetical protein Pcinc_035199 [Petrolisthes cinctipes]|uniref:Calcification-associated peptide-2 n=1 Tax=Petrolisthes cinctipes TaxID=88211 RepID=A0AAE1BXC9_PETCI|nr:hypothetical protein Pcinc_035199 [Petrolisthes cinctipes]